MDAGSCDCRFTVRAQVQIVAELGSNHDGSLGQAMALADAVIAAGADVVKLQDHRGQDVLGARHPKWMHPAAVNAESRHDYIVRTCFAPHEWGCISAHVRARGALFSVSPFTVEALADQLRAQRLDIIKIASGQITNEPLLRLARDSGLPVHVSCGMTSSEETMQALSLGGEGWFSGAPGRAGPLTILHCTSEYPCSPDHVNVRRVSVPWAVSSDVGFSDHTLGVAASLAAITLGAQVIERHVGWDRRAYSSDSQHSLTIDEFAAFVREARCLERMLRSGRPDLRAVREAFLCRR